MISRNRQVLLLSISLAFFCGVEACSAPDNFHYDTCDPKILSFTDPECRDVDAGTDAESDANDVDAANARAACTSKGGECVAPAL